MDLVPPQGYQRPPLFCAGLSSGLLMLPTQALLWIWKQTTSPLPLWTVCGYLQVSSGSQPVGGTAPCVCWPSSPEHSLLQPTAPSEDLKGREQIPFLLGPHNSSTLGSFVRGSQSSWQHRNYQHVPCAPCCLFTSPSLPRLRRLPQPPLESWRNTARRVDVRIRLWQHESFIKIPVMLSSLAGALRPYFSESNFRFRHKYVLLVYHKLPIAAP